MTLRNQQTTSRFTPRSHNSNQKDITNVSNHGSNNPFRETNSYKDSNLVRESAPIIINRDEAFSYKAPSSIHETVVNTLRREKDNLQVALAQQRESSNSLASKMTQLGIRNAELERDN